MKKTMTSTAGLMLVVACGSQAGPDYAGEPLFQFGAKVVVQNPDAPANLVPAIAFVAEHEGRDAIFVDEVDYQGTFPNDVRLSLFAPPPQNSIVRIDREDEEKLPDEPAVAIGRITAVPEGKYTVLRYGGVSESCSAGDGEVQLCVEKRCGPSSDAAGDEACWVEEKTCTGGRDAGDGPRTCEVTNAHGDEEFAEPLERKFAGLSVNVYLVYLESPAAARTMVSYALNQGRPVPAGYSLVRVEPAAPEEKAESTACYRQASDGLLGAYNDEHGTTYENLMDIPGGQQKNKRDTWRAVEDRGCDVFSLGGRTELVDVSSEPRITIAIGVEGLGLGND